MSRRAHSSAAWDARRASAAAPAFVSALASAAATAALASAAVTAAILIAAKRRLSRPSFSRPAAVAAAAAAVAASRAHSTAFSTAADRAASTASAAATSCARRFSRNSLSSFSCLCTTAKRSSLEGRSSTPHSERWPPLLQCSRWLEFEVNNAQQRCRH